MQKISGQEFADMPVELDGKHFERCKFMNCTMIYSGGELPIFAETSGSGGTWEMKDAANRTLNFLAIMNQIRPEMVDSIFQQIKTARKK